MRKSVALAAAGSLVAIGGAAYAQDFIEKKIELGNWKVDAHDIGEFPQLTLDFDLEANNNDVVGFRVDIDYVNQFGDSSWASDLEFKITAPNGRQFIVGQADFNGGDPFGPQDAVWDFDGAQGQPDGHYTSTHMPGAWVDGIPKGGAWNVMLAETWDGGVEYNNISLTLLKIPAPGALALLGVAGLLGVSRRRRC